MRLQILQKFIPAACIALLAFSARIGLAETAPDFTAERLTGGKFRLVKVLEEGPILLHFWDTCCPGCKEALPAVQTISEEFSGRLKVIGIATDSPKSQSKVKPFVKSNGYKFDILLDPDLEVRKLFGGTESPCSILITAGKEIVLKRVGASKDETTELRSVINTLLDKINQTSTIPPESH